MGQAVRAVVSSSQAVSMWFVPNTKFLGFLHWNWYCDIESKHEMVLVLGSHMHVCVCMPSYRWCFATASESIKSNTHFPMSDEWRKQFTHGNGYPFFCFFFLRFYRFGLNHRRRQYCPVCADCEFRWYRPGWQRINKIVFVWICQRLSSQV